MPNTQSPQRWWTGEEPSLVAGEVVAICDQLYDEFAGKRAVWREMEAMYEPRAGAGDFLGRLEAIQNGDFSRPKVTYPISRSLVSTVIADIAGRQRPKPLFMTTDADWKTKRKAKKRGRFVVGQMAQEQNGYLDVWEVMEEAELRCAVYGISWIHIYGCAESERVRYDLVPAEEILYDEEDAAAGSPNNLFRVRWIDEDEVLYTYVDEPLANDEIDQTEADLRRSAIFAAPNRVPANLHQSRVCRQVKVCEAWRVPVGKQREGRHVIAVSNVLLADEPWTRDTFPFVVMRWSREIGGFGGIGIVEEAYSMALELNEAFQHAQQQHALCAGRRIYVPAGSVEINALQANEIETIIEVAPGFETPQETVIPAINTGTLSWIRMIRDLAHEGTGVSQMSAQGRKEPGLEAGVALRTMIDIATKRFALKARAYENAYIQVAKLTIRAVQDLAEQNVSVRSRFLEMMQEYSWEEIDLPEDIYTIQIDAVSASADRAAGRMATLQEMTQSGLINAESYSRIAPPGGTLDLAGEASATSKQERYLSKLIDRFLDMDPTDKDFMPELPDGFLMDIPGAIRQFVGAYYEAKLDDAPDENLKLLREYITALDHLIDRANAKDQEVQQAAQAAQAPTMGMPQPQGMAA